MMSDDDDPGAHTSNYEGIELNSSLNPDFLNSDVENNYDDSKRPNSPDVGIIINKISHGSPAGNFVVHNELYLTSDSGMHNDESPIPPLSSLAINLQSSAGLLETVCEQRESTGGLDDRRSAEMIQSEITRMYETDIQREIDKDQQPTVSTNKKEKNESEEKEFSCLYAIPVGSLIALVLGLFGLSVFGGGLMYGLSWVPNANSSAIEYTNYAIYSLLSFYFVYMIFHFIISVISNDQNENNIFQRRNSIRCGRGVNTVVIVISFISVFLWTVLCTLISKPVIDGVRGFLQQNSNETSTNAFTDTILDNFILLQTTCFKNDIKNCQYYTFFQSMCVALFGNFFVICGLIQFIICSATNYASLQCRESCHTKSK